MNDVRAARGDDMSAGVRGSGTDPEALPDTRRRKIMAAIKKGTGRRISMVHHLPFFVRQASIQG
jgi:hypothetical protein